MKNGAKEAAAAVPGVTLNNPFVAAPAAEDRVGRYEATLSRGLELRQLPYIAAGPRAASGSTSRGV